MFELPPPMEKLDDSCFANASNSSTPEKSGDKPNHFDNIAVGLGNMQIENVSVLAYLHSRQLVQAAAGLGKMVCGNL